MSRYSIIIIKPGWPTAGWLAGAGWYLLPTERRGISAFSSSSGSRCLFFPSSVKSRCRSVGSFQRPWTSGRCMLYSAFYVHGNVQPDCHQFEARCQPRSALSPLAFAEVMFAKLDR